MWFEIQFKLSLAWSCASPIHAINSGLSFVANKNLCKTAVAAKVDFAWSRGNTSANCCLLLSISLFPTSI